MAFLKSPSPYAEKEDLSSAFHDILLETPYTKSLSETATNEIYFVLPTKYLIPSKPAQRPADLPTLTQLLGTWYILCSSSSFWSNKCNVTVTYNMSNGGANTDMVSAEKGLDDVFMLDDLASYQLVSSNIVKAIGGRDKPVLNARPGIFDWRGIGWLQIAGSRWEILGHGYAIDEDDGTDCQWMVVYSEKSIFTPAGVGVYCRKKKVGSQVMIKIRAALMELDHATFREEVREMRDIWHGK